MRENITIVETESGAVYHLTPTAVRRYEANSAYRKRGDSQWLHLLQPVNPVVGRPMVLHMQSLSHLGPDDHNTPQEAVGSLTIRTTTPVKAIR